MGRTATYAIGVVALSVFAASRAAASVRVTSRVEPRAVLLGETVTLVVTVERRQVLGGRGFVMGSAYDSYVRPSMPDFDVLSRSQSESTQVVFGGRRAEHVTTVTFRYVLRPRRAGRLRIGSARVRVGGRVYTSQPVVVEVRGAGGASSAVPGTGKPQGSMGQGPVTVGPPANLPGAIPAIGVEVDKAKVYVGQQVTANWVLYHTEPLRELNPISLPSSPDALVEDIVQIGPRTRTNRRIVGGRIVLATPLYRKAFFPTKVGKVRIDPLVVDVRFVVSGWRSGKVRLRSEALELQVQALPATGRPPGFPTEPGANVGTYTIQAQVDRDTLRTGEAITLSLRAAGVGHPDLLVLPTLPPLDGFKVRKGKPRTDLRVGDQVAGSKTVEYVLIALKPGRRKIPALRLPYFDPADGRYHVARTKPVVLQVTGKPVAGSAPPQGSGEPNVLVRDIRPIHTQVALVNRIGPTFYRSRLFLFLVLLPLVVLVLLIGGDLVRRRLGRETEAKRWRRTRGEARRRLKEARRLAEQGDARAFFAELSRVLSQVVSEKLGVKVSGLTFEELESRMRALGVDDDLADRIVRELRDCDFARFAPAAASPSEMADALERVRRLVGEVASLDLPTHRPKERPG